MAKAPLALKKGTAPRVTKARVAEASNIAEVHEGDASSPVVLGKIGKFTFTMSTAEQAPPPSFRSASARELPFKTWFPQMKHNQPVFLPRAWWLASVSDGGREVSDEKVTSTYVRTKVRDAFKKWRDADLDTRSGHTLIMVERKEGDSDGEFTEDGFSLYMQITIPAPYSA